MPRPFSKHPEIGVVLRVLLAVLALVAAVLVFGRAARATDAAPMSANLPLAGIAPEADQARLRRTLQREGYVQIGEVRRKGQMVILTAVQRQVSWRLVLDLESGEIVGRKPLND